MFLGPVGSEVARVMHKGQFIFRSSSLVHKTCSLGIRVVHSGGGRMSAKRAALGFC